MHINDLYEAQSKALLTKLCDALGMAEEDRTKSGIEAAIAGIRKPRKTSIEMVGKADIETAESTECLLGSGPQ